MSEDADVSASVNKLSLTTKNEPTQTTKPAAKKKAKKAVVADSWEDEDSSDSEPEAEPDADELTPSATPAPPPPTPMSPAGGSAAWTPPEDAPGPRAGGGEPGGRRPEKTDAVARRMIAAGLGLKAPKQTDEQRAYQKSIREQEKKRREQEREEEKKRQEEAEKAKAAIWDD